MYFFNRFIIDFFMLIDRFITKKYVIGDNHFIRNRKMTQKEYTKYILVQRGCTDYIEAVRFFTLKMNKDFETITCQAIGKQRMNLSPNIYIDMFEIFIDNLYNKFKGFSKYKGFIIGACDGSIFDLPNFTLTRNEFPVSDKTLLKNKRTRARVSCILDVNSKHILTAKIVEREKNEIDLAIEHLNNLNKRFNLEKFITIYDRGYSSIELMMKTIDLGSKFLIRLPKNVFKHQIKNIKTNDEIININLTKARLNYFNDEKLRQKAEKIGRLKIRITLVDIGNDEVEILATNLTQKEFNSDELKELYSQRWTIETGFDRLKNIIEIEEFSGNRRRIIEQDFYAHIFIYNLATTIKTDSEKRITRKPKNKDKTIIYQPNFAKIIGNTYLFFYDLITEPRTKKEKIIDFIIKQGSKELTQENISKNRIKERKTPDVNNKHPGNKKKTH